MRYCMGGFMHFQELSSVQSWFIVADRSFVCVKAHGWKVNQSGCLTCLSWLIY